MLGLEHARYVLGPLSHIPSPDRFKMEKKVV